MRRFAGILFCALALVACGGGDDEAPSDMTADSTSNASAVATSAGSTTAPAALATAATTSGAGGSEVTAASTSEANGAGATETSTSDMEPVINGAPPHEDPNFPDVHLALEAGSSADVKSSNIEAFDEDSADRGTIKVTLIGIIDPATATNPVTQPAAGNRLWATEVRLEATSDKNVNTGEWWLTTSDGNEYETAVLTGVGHDILYGSLAAGETEEGVVVFEIPEMATVTWLRMEPSIYVGGNIVFIAPS